MKNCILKKNLPLLYKKASLSTKTLYWVNSFGNIDECTENGWYAWHEKCRNAIPDGWLTDLKNILKIDA